MISITIEAETPAQVIDKLQAMLATWTPSVVIQAPVPEAAAGNGSSKIHTLGKPKAVAKAKPSEPEAEPEQPPVTLDMVKQAVTEFLNANEKEATLKLLQKHGKSSNISGIDKKLYPAVYEAARVGVA